MPDRDLIAALEAKRGLGRDDSLNRLRKFFRYPAPKIVKCHVSESSKKYFETKYPPISRQRIWKALQRKCL